jgi:hypothetical protein
VSYIFDEFGWNNLWVQCSGTDGGVHSPFHLRGTPCVPFTSASSARDERSLQGGQRGSPPTLASRGTTCLTDVRQAGCRRQPRLPTLAMREYPCHPTGGFAAGSV